MVIRLAKNLKKPDVPTPSVGAESMHPKSVEFAHGQYVEKLRLQLFAADVLL